jgi:hypothetical protein
MVSLPETTNHAPVTVALIANALVAVVLAILKQKFNIDFSGQEANLQVLATAAGYLVPGLVAKVGG